MKESKENKIMLVDNETSVLQGDKNPEFDKKLEGLKNKVIELRGLGEKSFKLELEIKNLANHIVREFSGNQVELGRAVSWLKDTYKNDELGDILANSIKSQGGFMVDVIDTELAKIPIRLDSGFIKPEVYSDERVTNLVNVINTYDNYIDTFESIELTNDSNCLDKNRYLISHDLHNILINGFRVDRDRTINKEDKGIYIVVFKVVNGTLIYKYIKYPYIFYDCLYSYIVRESSSLVITNDNSVGVDYLFVMENIVLSKDDLISEIRKISDQFKHKSLYRDTRGIFPRNIMDLFKMLLQGCPVILNKENISKYIKLSIERKYYDMVVDLVNLYGFYTNSSEGMDMLKNKLGKPNIDKYNFLGRIVFVTEDLYSLLKELKMSVNSDINPGNQKWRGQSDSLSNTIHAIDTDFRRSMNRHNQWHVNSGNIPRNSLIGRSKFSYQNIHLNIGSVRWYSTNQKKRIQPVIQDTQELFLDIGEYIQNSPVNKDTQLKIENCLYNQSYISLTEKLSSKDKPLINYKLVNKKFSKLLMEERVKLEDYINRDRQISFDKEPAKVNDKILYLLNKVLNESSNNYVVAVVYGRFFKIISQYDISMELNGAVNLFVDVGRDLVENYYYNLYKKCKDEYKNCGGELDYHNYKLSDWKRENNDTVTMFTNTAKAEIGGKVIGWLKNMDLIRIETITKSLKEKENVIVPTERVLSFLEKEIKIKPLPRRLPMIIKPNIYKRIKTGDSVKEVLGGYLLNDEKYVDPLMIPKWNFGKSTTINDENLVYDLVNNINSVSYKVNKDVLDFIGVYNSRYDLVINSNYIHPLSKKTKLIKSEYNELTSFLSRKDLQYTTLALADLYSGKHEFFLPTNLDFRGRLYCVSEYLSYQSTELAKALLLFSKGEKLYKSDKQSINYLKAYGANCYGNKLDKMSWENRCKWVDDNTERIMNFKNGELIEKAEKKLLFIAFCFEYNKYLESLKHEEDYFETHLPIQLDATCNGYQHLSLLSLDHDLAEELNLTKSSWADKPKDFYNFTGVKLVNYFKDRLKDNNLTKEEKETYTKLSSLTIARKIVKKVIMTIPYNVGYLKILDYLKENLTVGDTGDWGNKIYYYNEDDTIQFKETDFPLIAKGLQIVLFNDRFKLKRLLNYLNKVVDVLCDLGLTVSWGTPDSGVLIEQSYLSTKEERLKVFAYTKKTFKVKVVDDKHKYKKRKQKIAFLPNLIHSLDAFALAQLVYYYFEDKSFNVKNIYTIHDCFAVTANNVGNLTYLLNHVYQKIYTEKSYLRQFDDNMLKHIQFHCKNTIDFDPTTLIITRKEDNKKLQYPSVEDVLGVNCNTDGLIKESSYLIH